MNNTIDNDKTAVYPVLALRGVPIFPCAVIHFDIGREKSIRALERAMAKDKLLFVSTQKDEINSSYPAKINDLETAIKAEKRRSCEQADALSKSGIRQINSLNDAHKAELEKLEASTPELTDDIKNKNYNDYVRNKSINTSSVACTIISIILAASFLYIQWLNICTVM